MSIGDAVPVFALFFFYVLPAMLLLLFFSLFYKLMKRLIKKFKEYKNTIAGAVHGLMMYSKLFSDMYVDVLVLFLIILPLIYIVIEFLNMNSMYAVEHFWDYTYPVLFTIVFLTAAKVWVNVVVRIQEVFFK